MEKDDEIKGTSNSLDFGARIYDPRVGTWLAVDPLRRKYPCISPYNFAANNPINLRDPDGNILVDANGNIIYSSDGKFGPEPDDPTEEGLVVEFARTEIVTIYGNNGQPIEALKRTRVRKYYTNVTKYDEQTNKQYVEKVWTTEVVENAENEAYDCHGYTFLGGNLWLDSERLIDLLEADGYFEAGEKTEGEKGDITVYCNEGVYTHSGVIIEGGQIRSKWGNGALKKTTEKEIFEYETADGERYGDQKEFLVFNQTNFHSQQSDSTQKASQ